MTTERNMNNELKFTGQTDLERSLAVMYMDTLFLKPDLPTLRDYHQRCASIYKALHSHDRT